MNKSLKKTAPNAGTKYWFVYFAWRNFVAASMQAIKQAGKKVSKQVRK